MRRIENVKLVFKHNFGLWKDSAIVAYNSSSEEAGEIFVTVGKSMIAFPLTVILLAIFPVVAAASAIKLCIISPIKGFFFNEKQSQLLRDYVKETTP